MSCANSVITHYFIRIVIISYIGNSWTGSPRDHSKGKKKLYPQNFNFNVEQNKDKKNVEQRKKNLHKFKF